MLRETGIASVVKAFSPIALRFLSALILTFWVGTALADKRVALIVGNSQYARISPKLPNPASDARDIADVLESIGFDVILRRDVGKGEFDHALAEFARKATNADTALFYYAGHALHKRGENYFLPTDIEVQDAVDVEYRAIDQGHILSAVERARGVKIIILDSSRDNPLSRQLAKITFGGGGETPGLARIDSVVEAIIFYATAPGHVANDGEGRNSPFTSALIRRIKEPGVEITTMFMRVANDVYAQTGGNQQPEVTSSLRTAFFFNPTESDSAAWSRVWESTNFRREAEDAKRQPFEAEKKRQEEAARQEAERQALIAERLAFEAEKKRQQEAAAKKEAEHLAREAEQKRREEALAKKEAEHLVAEAEKKLQPGAARKEAKRVALVIGNSAYQSVTALPNPARDAEAIAAMFRAAGFNDVWFETNVGVAAMRRALRDFAYSAAADADTAVVFFAGHGIEIGGRNYLIPADAKLVADIDTEDEAIDLERVLQLLDPVRRLKLVILDACRDNPFARHMKLTTASRSIGRGLALPELQTSNTLVAFAARAGAVAEDGSGRNSPFTTALLHNLTKPGVDVRIALGEVHDEVLEATDRKQEPFIYGALGGGTLPLAPQTRAAH